jgi:hypothetical protein
LTGELSQRDSIAALPEAKRKAFADSLSQGEAEELLYNWGGFLAITASPQGLVGYLDGAGRGFGRTRTGVEWVRAKVNAGTQPPLLPVALSAGKSRGKNLSADAVHHTPASVLTVAGLA